MDQNRRYEEYELNMIADALYDGGWRAHDKEWMMKEYGYTEEEIKQICDRMRDIAEWEAEEEE